MTPGPRVGIFGGTFNPIHVAHLRAAEEVREILGLERVIFVPSARPPHKTGSHEDPLAPAELRLDWVRAATADHPHFEVDDLEIERGGSSYSVETLRVIGGRVAPERPVFVIGHDAFAEVDSWHQPRVLFDLANFAVMTRPPRACGSLAEVLPKCIRDDASLAEDGRSATTGPHGNWIRLVEIAQLDVSSSDIRARLRDGRSVRYLLPESVRRSVEEAGVYGALEPEREQAGRG